MKDLRKGKASSGLVLCFFLALPLLLPSLGFCQADYVFVLKWGSYGTGDGQFFNPVGIEIDLLGNVYVTDNRNHRIQKFDSEGNFLTSWGSYGTGDGQFRWPYDLAIDSFGNVYVTDNNKIQKFDENGNFLTKWGSYGVRDGQFIYPKGAAIDASGFVYVVERGSVDMGCIRVQKFEEYGNFLTKWGSPGFGDGQFVNPMGLAADLFANVFVADTNNYRIQKFDADGNFLTKWSGQFSRPFDLANDSSGNVYVVDTDNNRVQIFDSNGNFLQQWGSGGADDGQFSSPQGIAVDSSGNVYVADTLNHRIQKFASNIDIPAILAFFRECIENGTLSGSGPGNSWHRMKALRNMLKSASRLIKDGLIAEACQQLRVAYKRCDGKPKPPDFVEGEAAPQLAAMIQAYRASLGCLQ